MISSSSSLQKPLDLPKASFVPPQTYNSLVSAFDEQLVRTIHPDNYREVIGVSTDSRNVFFGELFLALDGEHHHGINFIASVFATGTRVFVVEEKYYPYELKQVLPEEAFEDSCFFLVKNSITAYGYLAKHYLKKIEGLRIAITGSAGKTTCKEMLTRVLGKFYGVFCNYKNENNHIGVPKNVFLLQRKLLEKKNPIHILIFEMGMNQAGEIDWLSSLVKPHIAIITNIFYSHIGNFSQREDLVDAKGEVISHLHGYPYIQRLVNGMLLIPQNIYGKDLLLEKTKNPPHPPLCREVKNPIKVNYQVIKKSSLSLTHSQRGEHREYSFISEWVDVTNKCQVSVPGLSVFVDKILPLILEVSEILKVSRSKSFIYLAEALSKESMSNRVSSSPFKFSKAESRLQVIDKPQEPLIIDDTYNSNPNSLIEVVVSLLNLFPQLPSSSRLIIVLGDILELGKFSHRLLEQCGIVIGKKIAKLPQDFHKRLSFFFLGPKIKTCYDNMIFPSKKYYEQYSFRHKDILQDLITECDVHSVVFFKASHAMNFQGLLKDFRQGFISNQPKIK